MIEKVLLAVDGSESSKAAARKVNELVQQRGYKKLTILNVATDYSWKSLVTMSTVDMDALHKMEEDMGQEIVKRAHEMITGDIEIVEKVLLGDPADVICEEAKNSECDMIVLGSTGRGSGSKFLLGSVSNRVLHFAHCPVLIVKE